jgi:hypothetical protein
MLTGGRPLRPGRRGPLLNEILEDHRHRRVTALAAVGSGVEEPTNLTMVRWPVPV